MEVSISRGITFQIPGFGYHSLKSSVSISDAVKPGESEEEFSRRVSQKLDKLFYADLRIHLKNSIDIVSAPTAEELVDAIDAGEQLS